MPEMMDGSTWEAFKALRDTDEELKEDREYEAQARATAEMVSRLEAKYAGRGLRFTQAFYGAMPVQAFGHLDGLRFYFRFRQNWGNLRLGPFDAELEWLDYERQIEAADRRLLEVEAKIAREELEDTPMARWDNRPSGPTLELDPMFLPTRIVKFAGREGFSGEENDYLGFLSDDEAFDLFSDLADSLEEVPASEQIDEYTKVLLFDGWAAADAYWQELLSRPLPEDLT